MKELLIGIGSIVGAAAVLTVVAWIGRKAYRAWRRWRQPPPINAEDWPGFRPEKDQRP